MKKFTRVPEVGLHQKQSSCAKQNSQVKSEKENFSRQLRREHTQGNTME